MIVPVHKTIRYLIGLAGVILAAGLLLSHFSRLQAQEVLNSTLLKEYFLPIQAQAPVEEGKVTIGPNECDEIGSLVYDDANNQMEILIAADDTLSPASPCVTSQIDPAIGYSPNISPAAGISARKINAGLQIDTNATISYKFTLSQPSIYQLRLTGLDSQDAFSNLTRNQYDYLNANDLFDSYKGQPLSNAFGGSFDEEALAELTARSLMFQVSVDSPDNVIGFINLNDTNEPNSNSISVGLLGTGAHTIYLTYANDIRVPLEVNLGAACEEDADCGGDISCVASICAYDDEAEGTTFVGKKLENFVQANRRADNELSKQPVLTNIELLPTQRTNDVLGVRVYTNTLHLSAWSVGLLFSFQAVPSTQSLSKMPRAVAGPEPLALAFVIVVPTVWSIFQWSRSEAAVSMAVTD